MTTVNMEVFNDKGRAKAKAAELAGALVYGPADTVIVRDAETPVQAHSRDNGPFPKAAGPYYVVFWTDAPKVPLP